MLIKHSINTALAYSLMVNVCDEVLVTYIVLSCSTHYAEDAIYPHLDIKFLSGNAISSLTWLV
uniref:Uncharacterized protein n=1 Tax=Rhizophora mucronata TaxID=61149 RepID=A0A2P2NS39_RHIMU